MFLAIRQGYYSKAIDHIESAPDVNIRDENGMTPLIRCAHLKDQRTAVGLARALIASGADISRRDKHGLNALHYSCIAEFPLLVDVLLAALDCDINTKCRKTGNTALHFLAINGNEIVSRKLVNYIKRYKLNIDVQNRTGDTALQLAIRFSNGNVTKLLISNGANIMLTTNVKVPNDSLLVAQQRVSSTMRKGNRKDPWRLRNSTSVPNSARTVGHSGEGVRQGKRRYPNTMSAQSCGVFEVSSSWREEFPFIWNKYAQQTR